MEYAHLNQTDAGITQDFDFGSMTDGAYGYLPNDRRHQFKLYGSIKLISHGRLALIHELPLVGQLVV